MAVRRARAEDDASIVDALVDAYRDDPIMNYALRSDRQKEAGWALYYRTLVEHFRPFEISFVDESRSAAALWVPPGRWEVGLRDQLRLAPRIFRMLGFGRLRRGLDLMQRMQAEHPTKPHYYLANVGVRRSLQGRGLGGALVRAGLDLADREKLPAYLESSNEMNLPLYRRHGFEVTKVLTFGGSVRMWLMWREGRV